jgi:hypothetical protein
MVKTAVLIAMAIVAAFAIAPNAVCQPCDYPTDITISDVSARPCTLQRASIPVYMTNPCAVGGFTIVIRTTDSTWLNFPVGDTATVDRDGSRIENWEYFTYYVSPSSPWKITITALAGGGPDLPPGQGLIFTLHVPYLNFMLDDTSQTLDFDTSRVRISDPTGYFLFMTTMTPGSFYVQQSRCHGNPRGDANCSGVVNGIDVTFLVAYLKGGASYCLLCSGDVNNSGSVNGIDVTYLIGYLKGFNPPPVPCTQ